MPVQLDQSAQIVHDYVARLTRAIERLPLEEIENAAKLVRQAYEDGRTIFTMGNGGSGSTASHLASDLNKGACAHLPRKFRVICLNDNPVTLTATANDIDYSAIFVEPLKNFMEQGDLVIAISGSGNSANVLKAVDYANEHGGITLGITGYDGGRLKHIARHGVHVNVNDMQIAEDLHLVFGHILMRVACGTLGDAVT